MNGTFDKDGWERRWAQALSARADDIPGLPPNPHVVAAAGDLPPGRALDAGAGHGAETRWLAQRGWAVTAVDFSATALAHARQTADALDPDIADRIAWVEADLGVWAPEPARYDLVVCVHVHVAGSVAAMVARLAAGVAPGGTLLLVGTRAPGQAQVSVADARAVLDPGAWDLVVGEERPRPGGRPGTDAVIVARAAICDHPSQRQCG